MLYKTFGFLSLYKYQVLKKIIIKGEGKLLMLLNIISLSILGYVDYKIYIIPNIILLAWAVSTYVIHLISAIPISAHTIILAGITAGMYIPLRQIVKCEGGDFKLFAVIVLATGPNYALSICLISMFISLIPLVSGIKKVPLALMTFFGYIAFLLLRKG